MLIVYSLHGYVFLYIVLYIAIYVAKGLRMSTIENNLKDRFFRAVVLGDLGSLENEGVVVRLKEFKRYFKDIKTQYVSSFMPAATFEPGMYTPSHTRFLFRVGKGVYLIHSDVLVGYMRFMFEAGDLGGGNVFDINSADSDDDSSVNEVKLRYKVRGCV